MLLSLCRWSCAVVVLVLGVLVFLLPERTFHGPKASCQNPIPTNYEEQDFPWRCGWTTVRDGGDNGISVMAYLQPNGSWSWSNAGLVLVGSEAILIDTLMDPVLTRGMLHSLGPVTSKIQAVVWTHPDVDHILGSQELPDHLPRIAAAPMRPYLEEGLRTARTLNVMCALASLLLRGSGWIRMLPRSVQDSAIEVLGVLRSASFFGGFNLPQVDQKAVDHILTEPLTLTPGQWTSFGPGRSLEYHYAGAIHSKCDTYVLVPESRVALMGDLLFVGIHPVMWSGPASTWSAALRAVLDRTDERGAAGLQSHWLFVPGHGPVVREDAVLKQIHYFEWLDAAVSTCPDILLAHAKEDRRCAESVLSAMPPEFLAWPEPERVLISVQVECIARRRGVAQLTVLEKARILGSIGAYTLRKELDLL